MVVLGAGLGVAFAPRGGVSVGPDLQGGVWPCVRECSVRVCLFRACMKVGQSGVAGRVRCMLAGVMRDEWVPRVRVKSVRGVLPGACVWLWLSPATQSGLGFPAVAYWVPLPLTFTSYV